MRNLQTIGPNPISYYLFHDKATREKFHVHDLINFFIEYEDCIFADTNNLITLGFNAHMRDIVVPSSETITRLGNYSFDSFIVCAQPFTKNPLVPHTKTQVFSGMDYQILNSTGDGNTPDRFSIIIPPYLDYNINPYKCINVGIEESIIDVDQNEVKFASLRSASYRR